MITKNNLIITFFFIFLIAELFCQTKIISTGDEWLYYDKEDPLPSDWFKNNSLNVEWEKGISPLGYGDSIITTTISFGKDPLNKNITKYFEKTFLLDDPYKYLVYKLNVQRDDGIVVYLNGQEVMRNNMPSGKITGLTKASSLVFDTTNEIVVLNKLLSPEDFVAGLNSIKVSVHQARGISSDCIFNLELIGSNDPEIIPLLLKEQTIKNLNFDIKLKEFNYNQEIEKGKLQLEFLEQSFNIIKYLFIISLILIILLLVFTFYLWKSSVSKQKVLIKNSSELSKTIQNKDQEMINISLNFLNVQQFLKELKKDLEEVLKKTVQDNELKKVIVKIIRNVEYNMDLDEDWENLKKHFNSVHSGYVDKLVKLHPSLTDIEIRHCIFIKLHMQTKEIARILRIDPRSVQASRYRLKKKMNLDESKDLKEYLMTI